VVWNRVAMNAMTTTRPLLRSSTPYRSALSRAGEQQRAKKSRQPKEAPEALTDQPMPRSQQPNVCCLATCLAT
jgi:hypothetical protein